MSSHAYDVLIAGGSFVGLALALGLRQGAPEGFRIAVVDPMPPDRQTDAAYDIRAAAVSAAARRMFGALGVWAAIEPHAQPVSRIEVSDTALEAPLRAPLLDFDGSLGPDEAAAYIVENGRMRRALHDAVAAAAPGIKLVAPQEATAFETSAHEIRVTLRGGETVSARLLVAADGQNSRLRQAAGIKCLRWDTDQRGIVLSVGHEKPHGGRMTQHFLPSGPFAMLPLTGERMSLVWTERSADAERLVRLPETELLEEIALRFGHGLGRLSILSRPVAYPMRMTLAREFARPRFALAGDAAHALHWIAGQGLNHGLKGAAALAEVVTDAVRLGLDFGQVDVLERYARWRRFDSATSALSAAAINGFFSNSSGLLRVFRGVGLNAVNRIEGLKRFFVSEAAGLTGELPRLLRGEPLR